MRLGLRYIKKYILSVISFFMRKIFRLLCRNYLIDLKGYCEVGIEKHITYVLSAEFLALLVNKLINCLISER